MLTWIAICLAVIYALIKPFAEGILNTSLWFAKITMPEGIGELSNASQLVKIRQAAYVDGWPSNIPFGNSLVFLAAIVTGFMAHWWLGIVVIFIQGILGVLSSMFNRRPVIWFITLISHRLTNRMADYAQRGDTERETACREMNSELDSIISLYSTSTIMPPTVKQIEANPYGDIYHLMLFNQRLSD